MKKNLIITIGREYGSSGREIGEKLSKKLGIPFYDKELLEIAAKETGIDEDFAATVDENTPRFLSMGYRSRMTDALFSAEAKFLQEKAGKESCIVVGRCSNFILKGCTETLNIFIHAPKEIEEKWVMEKHGIDREDAAKKIVEQVNKERASYYHYYTDSVWGSRSGYDLIIDSSILGVEGTADLLEEIIKKVDEAPPRIWKQEAQPKPAPAFEENSAFFG